MSAEARVNDWLGVGADAWAGYNWMSKSIDYGAMAKIVARW